MNTNTLIHLLTALGAVVASWVVMYARIARVEVRVDRLELDVHDFALAIKELTHEIHRLSKLIVALQRDS